MPSGSGFRPSFSGTIKDLEEWVTGDEPMTGAQDSYLHTLAREAGEKVDENLTKAAASEKIEELQQQTGRGGKPRTKKKAARKSHDRETRLKN